MDEVEAAREIIIQVRCGRDVRAGTKLKARLNSLTPPPHHKNFRIRQVDAFNTLGQESNSKGWKTEDRPALKDIYGVKKSKNGNAAEQLAA